MRIVSQVYAWHTYRIVLGMSAIVRSRQPVVLRTDGTIGFILLVAVMFQVGYAWLQGHDAKLITKTEQFCLVQKVAK